MSDGPDYAVIALGKGAERLMAEPAFATACEQVEENLIAEWKGADTVGARELAHSHITALYMVVGQLGVLSGDGLIEKRKEVDEDE